MLDTPKTLIDQIAEYTPEQIDLYFAMKDSENNYILNGTTVTNYLKYTYGLYKTRADLHTLWSMYNAIHYADFLRAYAAYTADYNPLDNYNGTETNVYLNNDGIVTERTSHGKITTITANNVETENQVTTFESTTYRPDSKSTQTGSTTNADSGTTATTTEHSTATLEIDGTTYTADNVHGEIKNRHGNLGVTTNFQMITGEMDLRKNPIAMLYIDEFVNTYAYYVTDSWGCSMWL